MQPAPGARIVLLLLPLALGGCGLGWLGGDEEDPPLQGERQSVMLIDSTLQADPALAASPLVLPPVRTNAEWPQTGGDASHSLVHVALDGNLGQDWRADVGRGNSMTSRLTGQPVVDNGVVYVTDATAEVQAFNLVNGEQLWSRQFDLDSDRRLGAGLAASGGGVFVATAAGEVAAIDGQSGEVIWSTDVGAPIRAAPTLVGRIVLVITADNQTFALDAVSGSQLWVHQGFAEAAAILGGASPATTDGLVVVPYSSGEVYGLILETGEPIWLDAVQRPQRTVAVGQIADIRASPVIDPSGRVIVAGHGGEIAALDLQTGRRLWDQRLATAETPWVAGEVVFVVTTEREVVALDMTTGGIRWATQLQRFRRPEDPESGRLYWTAPILAGSRLLVAGSRGELAILSPGTGAVVEMIEIADGVTLPPVVADGRLMLLDDNGVLNVYR
ncbi:MAG: PQQ-binding-like beta-propeller repeat protein [Pseudomonadota bacterium]